jgi:hypothetical protein
MKRRTHPREEEDDDQEVEPTEEETQAEEAEDEPPPPKASAKKKAKPAEEEPEKKTKASKPPSTGSAPGRARASPLPAMVSQRAPEMPDEELEQAPPLGRAATEGTWKCTTCGDVNPKDKTQCEGCHAFNPVGLGSALMEKRRLQKQAEDESSVRSAPAKGNAPSLAEGPAPRGSSEGTMPRGATHESARANDGGSLVRGVDSSLVNIEGKLAEHVGIGKGAPTHPGQVVVGQGSGAVVPSPSPYTLVDPMDMHSEQLKFRTSWKDLWRDKDMLKMMLYQNDIGSDIYKTKLRLQVMSPTEVAKGRQKLGDKFFSILGAYGAVTSGTMLWPMGGFRIPNPKFTNATPQERARMIQAGEPTVLRGPDVEQDERGRTAQYEDSVKAGRYTLSLSNNFIPGPLMGDDGNPSKYALDHVTMENDLVNEFDLLDHIAGMFKRTVAVLTCFWQIGGKTMHDRYSAMSDDDRKDQFNTYHQPIVFPRFVYDCCPMLYNPLESQLSAAPAEEKGKVRPKHAKPFANTSTGPMSARRRAQMNMRFSNSTSKVEHKSICFGPKQFLAETAFLKDFPRDKFRKAEAEVEAAMALPMDRPVPPEQLVEFMAYVNWTEGKMVEKEIFSVPYWSREGTNQFGITIRAKLVADESKVANRKPPSDLIKNTPLLKHWFDVDKARFNELVEYSTFDRTLEDGKMYNLGTAIPFEYRRASPGDVANALLEFGFSVLEDQKNKEHCRMKLTMKEVYHASEAPARSQRNEAVGPNATEIAKKYGAGFLKAVAHKATNAKPMELLQLTHEDIASSTAGQAGAPSARRGAGRGSGSHDEAAGGDYGYYSNDPRMGAPPRALGHDNRNRRQLMPPTPTGDPYNELE